MEARIRNTLPVRLDLREWKMWIPGTGDSNQTSIIEDSIYGKIPKSIKKELMTNNGHNPKQAEETARAIINIQITAYNTIWKKRNNAVKHKKLRFRDRKKE